MNVRTIVLLFKLNALVLACDHVTLPKFVVCEGGASLAWRDALLSDRINAMLFAYGPRSGPSGATAC